MDQRQILTAMELRLEQEMRLERARLGLLNFTRYTKPDYEVNWHHRVMASYLNQVVEGTINRLIICMPPRHGKSEMASVRFPAYLLGRNPRSQIIAASYNATLAAKMNRSVQRVIDSEAYRQLFPGTQLNSKNIRSTSAGSWLRNTDEFEVVNHGGFYRSAGVGGSATGYGATCFVKGSMVETEHGAVSIENFFTDRPLPRVWGYDHSTRRRKLCKVIAVSRARSDTFTQVTFPDGSSFTCTPQHMVYTRDGGYRAASDCGPSTCLIRARGQTRSGPQGEVLHAVPQGDWQGCIPLHGVPSIFKNGLRDSEVWGLQQKASDALGGIPQENSAGQRRQVLLRTGMYVQGAQPRAGHRQGLLALRQTQTSHHSGGLPVLTVLHRTLPRYGQAGAGQAAAHQEVFDVSQTLPVQGFGKILFNGLQKQSSLQADGWQVQPGFCGWPLLHTADVQPHLQKDSALCASTGWPCLCLLRQEGEGLPCACASHKREEGRQSAGEFNNAVRELPFQQAPLEDAYPQAVESFSGGTQYVYDIQVEGCHNYFVNKTLVHNCGIIDDPVKNREEANSATYRERNWDWYTSTFYSRLEKHGSILICATRWHEDDLIGRLLRQAKETPDADQWTVVNLAGICEEAGAKDDPREVGQPLWPNKYDLKRLGRIQATIGPRDWVSLYQQRPAPAEGEVIKKAWWKFWKVLPTAIDLLIISADLNFKETQRSDFTVFQVWAKAGKDFYLVAQVRARMGWIKQKHASWSIIEDWPDYDKFYIEDAANGPALVAEMQETFPGILPVQPKGSKLTRLEAVSGLIEAGNVYLPDPSQPENLWVNDLISEVAVFPNGANDDQVDALTMALSQMRSRFMEFDFAAGTVDKPSFGAGLTYAG